MYQAPDFVKVDFKIDEAFATYNCKYMSDGEAFWLFEGDGCTDEYYNSGTDVSGTVAEFAPWQCWITPSA